MEEGRAKVEGVEVQVEGGCFFINRVRELPQPNLHFLI